MIITSEKGPYVKPLNYYFEINGKPGHTCYESLFHAVSFESVSKYFADRYVCHSKCTIHLCVSI